MARKVITVTYPDGTKKVIVGKESNMTPVKTRELEDTKRPKPMLVKAGLTKDRTPYKCGGKLNARKR